jgi:hypothetical protein
MKNRIRFSQVIFFAAAILTGGIMTGCSKSSDPVTAPAAVPVNLAVSFSKSGTGTMLMKNVGLTSIDSLRIDSAVVVLQRIKFESHVDSVTPDTSGKDSTENESEANITFKGPFVIHVRDTLSINFANQTLPAGTYDGIKFKIHRFKTSEKHEDSDEHNNRPMMVGLDSSLAGSSIIVWGAIKRNGVWTRFTYKFNGEVEFKIKGNFVVSEVTSTVGIALNFNMGLWFTNPDVGGLLDPTDTSNSNWELFKRAIYLSFGKGKGGHDDNGDGFPDH